jgi:hypothetical protein
MNGVSLFTRLPIFFVNRRFIAFFVCCAALCGLAQSQPPAPTPATPIQNQQGEASPEKQKTRGDQEATKVLSTSVDKLTAEVAKRNEREQRDAAEKDSPQNWWTINGTNVVIAFFTAVLALVACLQWRTYEKQAKLMGAALVVTRDAANAAKESADATKATVAVLERTAERQLRAYLYAGLATAEVQDPFKQKTFIARITLTNAGQTPAKKMRIKARADIFSNPLPAGHVFQPAYGIGETYELGPNQVSHIPAAVPTFQIAGEVAAIKKSEGKALYMWGVAEYEDVFTHPRITNFGVMITWHPDDATFTTTFLPGYNSST